MFHGRHVDEITSRERDVACDPGSLFGDRFLRDLNQDFLAFVQHIADGLVFGAVIAVGNGMSLAPGRDTAAAHIKSALFILPDP